MTLYEGVGFLVGEGRNVHFGCMTGWVMVLCVSDAQDYLELYLIES